MRIDWKKYNVWLVAGGRSPWPEGVDVAPEFNAQSPVTDFGFMYFCSGRGTVTTPHGRERIAPGSCLWRRPGWLYDVRQDPKKPFRVLFIHFELRDAQRKVRPWEDPLPPDVVRAPDPKMAEAICDRVVDLIYGSGEFGYSWAPPAGEVRDVASALLQSLLMDLDRESDRSPAMHYLHKRRPTSGAAQRRYDRFMEVITRILQSPERLPTVEAMAEQTGYTRAHFSRSFKQATQRSPQQFIIDVRTNRAEEMLAKTSQSVTQIAKVLGYPDI